jgi:hypothetical protein
MIKKSVAAALTIAVTVLSTLLVATTANAAASPACQVGWGSQPKTTMVQSSQAGAVTDVRAGRHECYERLVIDFDAGAGRSDVKYVAGVPFQSLDGTLELRGGAFLQIVLRTPTDSTAVRDRYIPTNKNELVNVSGWNTFRQVGFGGSFEGYTTIGLGVRATLPFRTFTLPGPGTGSRLVIDVAHHWDNPTELPAPTSTALQASALGDDHNADLIGVRTAAHPGYDRVVFDFEGPESGLRYVALYQGSQLRVDLEHGTALTATGARSYLGPTMLTPCLGQVRAIQLTNFTADGTTAEITVRHKAGFRVFQLSNPARIVIDIAH